MRFGHTSCVTGHKTSAVSRPCISQDRSMAVVKSWNNRKIASKNSQSTASGLVSASKRQGQISSNAVSNGQSNVQQFQSPYLTPPPASEKFVSSQIEVWLPKYSYDSGYQYTLKNSKMHNINIVLLDS